LITEVTATTAATVSKIVAMAFSMAAPPYAATDTGSALLPSP
jgi:hypothetical protein